MVKWLEGVTELTILGKLFLGKKISKPGAMQTLLTLSYFSVSFAYVRYLAKRNQEKLFDEDNIFKYTERDKKGLKPQIPFVILIF